MSIMLLTTSTIITLAEFYKPKQMPSSSSSFCTVPVVTNMIGPEVRVSCIFYGPVHLEGNRPFVITEHEEVEKVFLAAKKQMF